jgi:hypothetical protein
MRKPARNFPHSNYYVESITGKEGRNSMSVHRLKPVSSTVKWKVKAKPYGGKRQALTQDELDRLFEK